MISRNPDDYIRETKNDIHKRKDIKLEKMAVHNFCSLLS